MKTRVITALVAFSVLILALVFLQTPLLGIFLVPLCAMAAFEICHVAKIKNKGIIAVSTVVGALVPPIIEFKLLERLLLPVPLILFCYFFLLVILMLARFEKTEYTHVLFALFASIGIPGAMSILLVIRDSFRDAQGLFVEKNLAIYFVFFTCCCAWLTDTYALFVGVKFGKHKLCPKISPKKTVEGALGGLFCATLTNVGIAAMFNTWFLELHRINLLAVVLISIPACIVAMLGDLSASTIKRNFGAKDFGKLFPGHGGVMDRFDSFVFVAPFCFAVLQLQPTWNLPLLYEVLR